MKCKHCDKPIEFSPTESEPELQWKHVDGYYGCYGMWPSQSLRCAEPVELEAA
jgi:hypothetical protein